MLPDFLGALRVGPDVLAAGVAGGPLTGRRLVVKDVIDVEGHRTGAGNPTFLEDAPIATEHAETVRRLLAAGATIIGKAHTDELAFSLAGTNVHYGTPTNTNAPGRIPGGSSSGPAAAVAGGLADIGLGTDTGGSVRIPASYCGIAGFRPTHGRVPVSGVVPLAPSFDTVGLLAPDGLTLRDAGLVLLGAVAATDHDCNGLVIADDLSAAADPAVADAVRAAAARLAAILGVSVSNARVAEGRLEDWLRAFRHRQFFEAWASHGAWIESRRPVLGPGIAARFAASREAGDPGPMDPLRRQVHRSIDAALGTDGLLVVPAAATTAPFPDAPAKEKESVRLRTQRLTCMAGLGGLPAVSLPIADVDGLPVGLCLIGRPGDDERLLAVAAAVDSAVQHPPWSRRSAGPATEDTTRQ
jgi:amidase